MERKVALVTGAGSGIGRAAALAFAGAGFDVILAGRGLARLEAVARDAGSGCLAVRTDVTDPDSVDSLFRRVAQVFGRLDVLFNNAGISALPSALEELSLAQWRAVLDTNVTGAFLCTQAAFRLMKIQSPRGGRIINNGSVSATTPRPHMIAYTASKHAMTGLTKATALEGREFEIACGQIDIGNTATALTASVHSNALQPDTSMRPEPMFEIKHVADALLYMASLPLEANVLFMTLMATQMPYVGRG